MGATQLNARNRAPVHYALSIRGLVINCRNHPSESYQQTRYCFSTGDTKQYWRSTVNYAGVVLAKRWHGNAIQY